MTGPDDTIPPQEMPMTTQRHRVTPDTIMGGAEESTQRAARTGYMSKRLAATFIALVLGLAACGGSPDEDAAETTEPDETTTTVDDDRDGAGDLTALASRAMGNRAGGGSGSGDQVDDRDAPPPNETFEPVNIQAETEIPMFEG